MPLVYAEDRASCTVELTIHGQLGQADYAAVMVPMGDFIEACGTINVVEVVQSFSGFVEAPGVPRLPMDHEVLTKVRRVALVSDIGWFCPILSAAPTGLVHEIRSYTLAELDAARDWARAGASGALPS